LAKEDAAPPRRKRRSSEEVGERILEAAVEEFEQSGFTGATTAAIARRAEVTEAQIFRFYESKQALFRAAVFTPLNRHFEQFHAAAFAEPGGSASMRELAHRYIAELQEFMGRHSRMLMSVIVASAYSPGATDGLGELAGLRAYFERGAAMMTKRMGAGGKVDPHLMVRVSFAAVLASTMFKDWLFPEDIADDAEIQQAIVDFVIDGLRANEPDVFGD
jgi:AcrR family transcriptional regulator